MDRDTVISPATYDVKGNCCADLRNLTDALQILETSHMSLVKPETIDDELLPAGWQLMTCWHFTAGRFNCRTSAALRSQQTQKGGKHSPASSSQPERYRVCVGEDVKDTEMENLIVLRYCRSRSLSALPMWIRTSAGAIRSLK